MQGAGPDGSLEVGREGAGKKKEETGTLTKPPALLD